MAGNAEMWVAEQRRRTKARTVCLVNSIVMEGRYTTSHPAYICEQTSASKASLNAFEAPC
jgi:hypothetical protein